MLTPPQRIIHKPEVLPALRALFSQYPTMTQSGPETLSRALHILRFLPYQPETFEVEALRIEGELAA
jgi:hypothetical protein